MQTEMMRIRLLRKNLKRKSGWEIKGYVLIDNEGVWFSENEQFTNRVLSARSGDARELGIKVGAEWWYSGDKLDMDGIKGTLEYSPITGHFIVTSLDDWCMFFADLALREGLKRIGTIHDEVTP